MRGQALRALSQHMTLDWLKVAYDRTRKDGALGVDGQSAKDYSENLESNLQSLLNRAKSGTYRAPPVRRTYIPKGDGKTRPLGIPTFEDKILQRAVAMLLEPVYEQDFYDVSYGFRPGRSAHDALRTLDQTLYRMRGGWVLDVDVQDFFGSLSHEKLRDLLRQRVVDGVVTRLIGKWLRAGVLEDGVIQRAEKGTPQGGVISPLLANVYLHEVLDAWWMKDVLPRMRGQAHLIRYADDFVMVFNRKDDADRVYAVLAKRFERFGLTLHPDKTRLVRFRPPEEPGGDPESFDFLGFTHYLHRTGRGYWIPRKKTSRKRLTRTLRAMNQWLRQVRHWPILVQLRLLKLKIQGHLNYYGLRGNSKALSQFLHEVRRLWYKWLGRRSQRTRLTWEAFNRLLKRYPLPPARLRPDELRRQLLLDLQPANP
jgi:group II intron reverse transcriptase/maturase